MKLLGTIAKTALSIAAMIFMRPDGLGSAIVAFAAVYGVITWYIHSFANGGIFTGIGSGGFILALILTLCLPALVLVIPLFILEAILPGEIGTIIYGLCVSLAGAGCVVRDFLHIIGSFRPDSFE